MKILKELLTELKRSNDLKEKEIDFNTLSDMDFKTKYDQFVPFERRQQIVVKSAMDNTFDHRYWR
jgi:hypothetical protein